MNELIDFATKINDVDINKHVEFLRENITPILKSKILDQNLKGDIDFNLVNIEQALIDLSDLVNTVLVVKEGV